MLFRSTYSVAFQVFWASPPNGGASYLASQARLMAGGRPVAECTQYAKDDVQAFFPVGACAGFVDHGDGTTTEYGVSFYPP